MRALQYQIEITDSSLHMAHGAFHTIDEVFVPYLGLHINKQNSFIDQERRVPEHETQEIEVDGVICTALRDALLAKDKAEDVLREDLFEETDNGQAT